MANFSALSNCIFPSPTAKRATLGNNSIGYPGSQSSLLTSTAPGIQFPSPTYQSASMLKNTGSNVINTVLGSSMRVSNHVKNIWTGASIATESKPPDWHHSVPNKMPWASQNFTANFMQFSAAYSNSSNM